MCLDFEEDQGSPPKKRKKLDYVVDLWPHSCSQSSYLDILKDAGAGASGTVLGLLTTSAHPAPWLAGLDMQMKTFALSERLSDHSLKHGRDIALKIQARKECAKNPSLKRTHPLEAPQFIQPPETSNDDVHQFFDLDCGGHWNAGLNKHFRTEDLQKLIPQLHAAELRQGLVSLTPVHEKRGRGLITCRAVREGQKICDVEVLWFSPEKELLEFLKRDCNAEFADSVIGPIRLRKEEKYVDAFAVMIGLGRFVQHYQGNKKQPNAVFKLDSSKGFGPGSVSLVVSNRNSSGISEGGEVVTNYGVGFNLEQAQKASEVQEPLSKRVKGPLDAFFEIALKPAEGLVDEASHQDKEASVSAAAEEPGKSSNEGAKGSNQASLNSQGGPPAQTDPLKGEPSGLPTGGNQGRLLTKLTQPKVEVYFCGGKFSFDNKEDGSKNLPPGTVLHLWCDGKLIAHTDKTPGDFAWTVRGDAKVKPERQASPLAWG